MPVEVREIIIKGTILDGSGEGSSGGFQGGGAPAIEEIIKACVEKVLEILKEKKER